MYILKNIVMKLHGNFKDLRGFIGYLEDFIRIIHDQRT